MVFWEKTWSHWVKRIFGQKKDFWNTHFLLLTKRDLGLFFCHFVFFSPILDPSSLPDAICTMYPKQCSFGHFWPLWGNFWYLGLPRGYLWYNTKNVSHGYQHMMVKKSLMPHKNGFWAIFDQEWAFGAVQVLSVQLCEHKKCVFSLGIHIWW